jgi:hypothetical protein
MERLGLDGRSFVLCLMGFGCNVPAILGTRVMRSTGLRLLTMLVIPFSLCSARLNVFLFMAAAFFTPCGSPVGFELPAALRASSAERLDPDPDSSLAAASMPDTSDPDPSTDESADVGCGAALWMLLELLSAESSVAAVSDRVVSDMPAGWSSAISHRETSSSDPAACGVGAVHETFNSSDATRTMSPSTTFVRSVIFVPLTKVPLRLPRSSTQTSAGPTVMAQCRRLTSSLSGRTSHCSARPIRSLFRLMAMDRPALLPDATIILTIMVGPKGGNRTGDRGAGAVGRTNRRS